MTDNLGGASGLTTVAMANDTKRQTDQAVEPQSHIVQLFLPMNKIL